jgi:ribonuclease HI
VILAFQTLTKLLKGKASGVDVTVKMDSELVVKQMNGLYKVKHPVLKEQKARVAQIVAAFKSVSFTHVPREQNSDADALANAAMDRGSNPSPQLV